MNEASREELLRVPGIGPLSASRILSLRSEGVRIRSRKQLAEIGVVLSRAPPFLEIDGKHQSTLSDWSELVWSSMFRLAKEGVSFAVR